MHGQIAEFAAVSEFTNYDQENDEARDPGIKFVGVHHLVAEKRDDERACSDNNDSSITWDVAVDRVDQLSSHNHIDR